MTAPVGVPLRLRPLDAGKLGKIHCFTDSERALAHICDHVLTYAESLCWKVAIPDLAKIVDVDQPTRLWELARSFWQPGRVNGEVLQRLYDGYATAIGIALREAADHNCFFWVGDECHAVGTSGVLCIFSRHVVRTAYFPVVGGLANGASVHPEERQRNALPRQGRIIGLTDAVARMAEGEEEDFEGWLYQRSMVIVRQRLRRRRKSGEPVFLPSPCLLEGAIPDEATRRMMRARTARSNEEI